MHAIPTLEISATERQSGRLQGRDLQAVYEDFRRAGVVLVKGAHCPEKLERLRARYLARYARFHQDAPQPGALEVSDRRRLVTVAIEGAFNDPEIYANPFVLALMHLFTSEDAVLGSFGVVVSLPGAADQGLHVDHPPLFFDARFDAQVPPYAILVGCPLIPLNALHGTTAVWPGSHLVPHEEIEARSVCVLPEVEVGDVLMMDYRVAHAGRANRSSVLRPVFYHYYARPWFRDCINYLQQHPLEISRAELERVPEELQYLFAFVYPTG